eukprot:g8981.t1
MLKYTVRNVVHENYELEDTSRGSSFIVAPWRASCGYSWIARSLSSLSRASIVLTDPSPADPEPSKRYGGRRILKPDNEREHEEQQRFWQNAKRYFEEVDAFQLLVESPTPFKHRNRGPNVEQTVAEMEHQRRGLKPLPNAYSISDALNGVLHQLQSPKETEKGANFQTPVRDSVSMKGPPCSAEASVLQVGSSLGSVGPGTPVDLPLRSLLEACDQCKSTQCSIPLMEDLLERFISHNQVMKIGEGTFGEAFKSGGHLVVKIVPFGGSKFVCGYPQKQAEELLPEIMTSKILSNLRSDVNCPNSSQGFALTHETKICKGPYPELLVKEWYRWSDCYPSENEPIDSFPPNQYYVVFFIEDGGHDLERFELRSFQEAKAILLQSIFHLAIAEEACQFEHRDLHWGNLLLTRTSQNSISIKLKGQQIECQSGGIKTVLIDFSLSRLQSDHTVIYKDLCKEPELFTGPSQDHQAETYRRMKKTVGDDWSGFHPETNCLWIHYLTETVLTVKKQLSYTVTQKQDLRAFKRRCLKAKSCQELLWDELFKNEWLVKQTS